MHKITSPTSLENVVHPQTNLCGLNCGRMHENVCFLHVSFFYMDMLAPPGFFFTRKFFYSWVCMVMSLPRVFFTRIFFTQEFFLQSVFFLQPLHPLVGFFTLELFYTMYVFFLPYPGFFLHVNFLHRTSLSRACFLHICFLADKFLHEIRRLLLGHFTHMSSTTESLLIYYIGHFSRVFIRIFYTWIFLGGGEGELSLCKYGGGGEIAELHLVYIPYNQLYMFI